MATNKRVTKKQQKKEQNKTLQRGGYSEKEIKQLQSNDRKKAVKKVTKTEQNRQRRENNKSFLRSIGIDDTIISHNRLYDKGQDFLHNPDNIRQWKKQTAQIKRRRTLEAKRALNFARLKEYGIPDSKIKKGWLIRNKDFIDKIVYNYPQEAAQWLYIGYAARGGGHNLTYKTDAYALFDIQEMLDMIDEHLEMALEDIDNSGDLEGFFEFFAGTEREAREHAYIMSQRGYNPQKGKFTREPYHTICIRNDWTFREYVELILLCLSHMSNADKISHYKDFEYYIKKNNLSFELLLKD